MLYVELHYNHNAKLVELHYKHSAKSVELHSAVTHYVSSKHIHCIYNYPVYILCDFLGYILVLFGRCNVWLQSVLLLCIFYLLSYSNMS